MRSDTEVIKTMGAMRETVKLAKARGLNDLRFIVGGAVVDRDFAEAARPEVSNPVFCRDCRNGEDFVVPETGLDEERSDDVPQRSGGNPIGSEQSRFLPRQKTTGRKNGSAAGKSDLPEPC